MEHRHQLRLEGEPREEKQLGVKQKLQGEGEAKNSRRKVFHQKGRKMIEDTEVTKKLIEKAGHLSQLLYDLFGIDDAHWRQGHTLLLRNLLTLPGHSYCFVLAVEDTSSPLPPLVTIASALHPWLTLTLLKPRMQINLSFCF